MTDHDFTQFSILPDEQKRDLCIQLLDEFGVDRWNETAKGELQHQCSLPLGGHTDGNSMSASINFKKLTFACLTGDTLVKVKGRGDVPIRELAGQTVTLLDGNGKWVDAPVRHYGKDRIYRVTLTRNKVRKVVETNAAHRWYVRPKGDYTKTGRNSGLVERVTTELKPKMRIPSVWPMKRTGRTFLSPLGVMAGFIYGDGTQSEWGSVANFYGEKDAALEPFFRDFKITDYSTEKYSVTHRKVISGLPRSWKELPRLDEGVSYLYGWLAGYFAADGCVDERGLVILNSADPQALRHVVAICDLLGIATYPMTTQSRVGRGKEATDLHRINFRSKTLDPDFFLIPQHRHRFEEGLLGRRYERTNWWVGSVEATERIEDVYCAEVSTTHSFVLADNVLTGNCFVCGNKGGLLWWIAVNRRETSEEARAWLEKVSGVEKVLDLPILLKVLESLANPHSKKQLSPIPTYGENMLVPWSYEHWGMFHPYLTDPWSPIPDEGGREIPEDTLAKFEVGYCDEDVDWRYYQRIIIPLRWHGKLVGWQARRLWSGDPETAKYKNSPDFPRDRALYGDLDHRDVVLVESPMSVLRHQHHLPMVATLGASISPYQLPLLHRYRRITLWYDNDKAGTGAILGTKDSPGLAAALAPYCEISVVQSPYRDADPADMTEAEAAALVADAVPFVLWRRPQPDQLIQYTRETADA